MTGCTLNSIAGTLSDTHIILKNFKITVAANTIVGTSGTLISTKDNIILCAPYYRGNINKTADINWPCTGTYSTFYIKKLTLSIDIKTYSGSEGGACFALYLKYSGSGQDENKLNTAQSYTWSNLNIKIPIIKW